MRKVPRRLAFVFLSALIFFRGMTGGEASAEIGTALLSALQSNDLGTRVSAVEQIGSIGDQEALSILMSVVAHKEENWKVRIRAIRFIGETGYPGAADLLMDVLANPFLNEECPSIKWNTVVALGNFSDNPRVVDALIGMLDNDNLFIREAAIQSLGKVRASKASRLLIKALRDKSFAIRIAAVRALSMMGGSEAVPFLKRISETDSDPIIKNEALSALKTMGQS